MWWFSFFGETKRVRTLHKLKSCSQGSFTDNPRAHANPPLTQERVEDEGGLNKNRVTPAPPCNTRSLPLASPLFGRSAANTNRRQWEWSQCLWWRTIRCSEASERGTNDQQPAPVLGDRFILSGTESFCSLYLFTCPLRSGERTFPPFYARMERRR